MQITLMQGTLDTTDDLDGWIITSPSALAEGAADIPLRRGDVIRLNGDVIRDGSNIANIA